MRYIVIRDEQATVACRGVGGCRCIAAGACGQRVGSHRAYVGEGHPFQAGIRQGGIHRAGYSLRRQVEIIGAAEGKTELLGGSRRQIDGDTQHFGLAACAVSCLHREGKGARCGWCTGYFAGDAVQTQAARQDTAVDAPRDRRGAGRGERLAVGCADSPSRQGRCGDARGYAAVACRQCRACGKNRRCTRRVKCTAGIPAKRTITRACVMKAICRRDCRQGQRAGIDDRGGGQ
ncbi:hypothetical protein SDC9_101605 [bioreactor metagenome]|uniref:Uncharacterized protein n=1 Tax=bioreactor metagenome TaxID=1076179 RepID=A0A645AV99_9ZZZZ